MPRRTNSPPSEFDGGFCNEEELLRRFVEGCVHAWQWLYQSYARNLLGFSRHRGLSLDDAQDVVSEAFVRLRTELAGGSVTFTSMRAVRAWLFIVCRNLCADRLKQLHREPPIAEVPEPRTEGWEDKVGFLAEEARESWNHCWGKLSPEQREVLGYRSTIGSFREMERVLGRSHGTWHRTANAAVLQLERCLDSRGWTPAEIRRVMRNAH